MKLTYSMVPAAVGLFLVLGSPAASFGQTAANMESKEQPVQMSDVPQPALDAAKKALHTAPTQAKVVVGTSPEEYSLMAKDKKSGKEKRVHVLADGTILKHGNPQRHAEAPSSTTPR